jgi:hypothetical protein
MATYFTSFGPQSGALLYSAAYGAIAVLAPRRKRKTIGVATCVGVDVKGQSLWTLNVRDADVPGRWIVVDRRFRPVKCDAPRLEPIRPGRRRRGGAGVPSTARGAAAAVRPDKRRPPRQARPGGA